MNHLTVETDDALASLLELAANNDVEGFKRSIEHDTSCVDEIGLWYSRQKGSKQMVNEHRTPLMVAATYGSIDVINLILSISGADVNRAVGLDKSTALHCAASGGAVNAIDVVKLLLAAGADPNLMDANGHHPVDVIVVPPKLLNVKVVLEELLSTKSSAIGSRLIGTTETLSSSPSPPLSSSPQNGVLSSSELDSSPTIAKCNALHGPSTSEKKEYPVDPSLPDIKNSIYSTDEFRMYSFKVRPCSRAYSHDWTECPFVHPGENARRRDPRKFHYSCVPCPDFRKGACRRGDMCEYAHGVFECWLHPAQYRTRLCKDGTNCARRVCFFAHTAEELRPLYVSTGSAVPSPRSGAPGPNSLDYAAAMNLLPGSPSSMSVMSPSPFTPPMSPSANAMSHSSAAWPQPNVPSLHLPGSNLQSSRLRSSLNARDIPAEEYDLLADFDVQQQQLVTEFSCLSQQSLNSNSLNRSGRFLTPSNLDDLFSAESSPRYSDQSLASAVFSPTHKSAILGQYHQQQNMSSPISTNFSSKNADSSLFQAAFGVPQSGRMSPRTVEPISPMSSRMAMLAQREKQQQFRSLSSRELGANSASIVGSPVNSWSKWGSSNEKLDWTVNADEFGKLRRSSSFELGSNGEEPDLSWVQSLVKESVGEIKERQALPVSGSMNPNPTGEDSSLKSQMEFVDHAVLGAWLEQMQLDHLVAQQN